MSYITNTYFIVFYLIMSVISAFSLYRANPYDKNNYINVTYFLFGLLWPAFIIMSFLSVIFRVLFTL